ncbi:MAG: hypothetical protein ABSA46_21875 [Thermodesulfovibrionales bacterium]
MKKLAISRWLKVCLIFFVVTLPLCFTGCASTNSLASYNVEGYWSLYSIASTSQGTVSGPLYPLIFTQSESTLSGTTVTGEGLSGSVNNVTINFSWTGAVDGIVNTYTGTINANATISGSWARSDGTTGTWYAIIYTPPADIQGTWQLSATPLGMPVNLTFTLNATYAGISSPSWFSITPASGVLPGLGVGTVSNQSILFPFSDNGVTYIFIGSVTVNGTMSGTWTGTNGQSGTWSALFE